MADNENTAVLEVDEPVTVLAAQNAQDLAIPVTENPYEPAVTADTLIFDSSYAGSAAALDIRQNLVNSGEDAAFASFRGQKQENLTETQRRNKENASFIHQITTLDATIERLDALYNELDDINRRMAERELERQLLKRELAEISILVKEKEEIDNDVAQAQAEVEKTEDELKGTDQAIASAEEQKQAAEAANDSEEIAKFRDQLESLNAKRLGLSQTIAGLKAIHLGHVERANQFNKQHPNLANRAEHIQIKLKELAEADVRDQARVQAIKEEIEGLKENLSPDDKAILEREIQEREQLLESAAYLSGATAHALTKIEEPRERGELLEVAGEIAIATNDPKLSENVENATVSNEQAKLLEELEAVMKDNPSRADFLLSNIKDFEEINARSLLREDGALGWIHNQKLKAGTYIWSDLEIDWSKGPHAGHETVTLDGKDIYFGTNPDTNEQGFYYVDKQKQRGGTEETQVWITDKHDQLEILRQAYLEAPPKPFYNETPKPAGYDLFAAKDLRNNFFEDKKDLSQIKEEINKDLHASIDLMQNEPYMFCGLTTDLHGNMGEQYANCATPLGFEDLFSPTNLYNAPNMCQDFGLAAADTKPGAEPETSYDFGFKNQTNAIT